MVEAMGTIITLLAAAVLGLVALLGVFLGGMRAKWPPVVDAVRRLNLRVLNPRQMDSAGQPGAFAGILRHVGRTSGTSYEVPLGIEPTEDGFVIALVYGERTQWLKNVLAAGQAEVVVEGVTYRVDRPEVVPIAEVIDDLPPSDRRLMGLFGVDTALRLHRAGIVDHEGGQEEGAPVNG
jgi:deazaflavin-dependent oxidoreductase (nitroreductase family)